MLTAHSKYAFMIIYNVTLNVENEIAVRWIDWMRQYHIPDVMATGFFKEYRFLKLLGEEDNGFTRTYAVQYYCENIEKLATYLESHAHALQKEHQAAFGEQVLAFRTMLEDL